MERYIKHIIESADKSVDFFLKEQVKDSSSSWYGGMKGSILDVKPTVYVMTTAVATYLNKGSRHYRQTPLVQAIDLGLDFVRRLQREDGSFDYPSCNFMSAPDTSFCLKRLIAAYDLLQVENEGAGVKQLAAKYLCIIRHALEAVKNGGFHTPNHRWAITAALMQGAELFSGSKEAEEYQKRAGQYLDEGIDGNEDGEYAERSTGNYNAVVNSALISLYEVTGDESYLGFVERNLHMMLTYIDPDDTIFTQNSTRQDKGKAAYADIYFYQYLYMAAQTGNPEFDAAAHKLIQDTIMRGDLAPDCLHFLMLYDGLMEYHFTGYGFLDSYKAYYKDSGVLRVKKEAYSYSVLKEKAGFFFMKVKELPIEVRIGESYCAIRNFVPQEMEVLEHGCRLSAVVNGWYYLPFEGKQENNDWWEMDHSKRQILNSSQLMTEVILTELEDGVEFHVRTEGIDRLPLRIEVNLPPGSILENEDFYFEAVDGQSMVLKRNYVTVEKDYNRVEIGPGCGNHLFKRHYSEDGDVMHGFTIYINEYTNCDMKFLIRVV